jgi:DNA-binding MarR family transcriptional regulator
VSADPPPREDPALAFAVLRLATQLVEGVQDGLQRRGFDDVRPQHGFAFVRISHGGVTVVELAHHLGTTKQATGQLVDQLVTRGYLERVPHPTDRRARVLTLTPRGTACTRAAEDAAAEVVAGWRATLGAASLSAVERALGMLVTPGAVRPSW